MKKSLCLLVALSLVCMIGLPLGFSDIQLDKGQSLSTNPIKFQLVRSANKVEGIFGTSNSNVISKDSVVVWDTVSDDGITVTVVGVSNDARVAGVLLDNLQATSTDSTASEDESRANAWARLQVWGRHSAVRWDASMHGAGGAWTSGTRVGTSASPGKAGRFSFASDNRLDVSRSPLGIMLDDSSAGATTMDVFIYRG